MRRILRIVSLLEDAYATYDSLTKSYRLSLSITKGMTGTLAEVEDISVYVRV